MGVAERRGGPRQFRDRPVVVGLVPAAIYDEQNIALVHQLSGGKANLGDVAGNPRSQFNRMNGIETRRDGEVVGHLAWFAGGNGDSGWGGVCGGRWRMVGVASGQSKNQKGEAKRK